MSNIPNFTIREMLEAGVHFGHKKNRWNPEMSQFIYGAKGDLHIIDLSKTYLMLNKALEVVSNVANNHGKILFVGTKRQSSATIAKFAQKCKQHYVNHRWLGGMLTNWSTVSNSIKTLNNIQDELANEESTLTKKEKLFLSRKLSKLEKSLGGIKDLSGKPALVVIFDTNKEAIAVKESHKLGIPVIAIVDTNSSLEKINYPIPGNDDSAKSTAFFCNLIAEAIIKSSSQIEQAKVQNKEISENEVKNTVDDKPKEAAEKTDSGIVLEQKSSNGSTKSTEAKADVSELDNKEG
jgi:small subunit ribosomal protein S2